MLGDAVAMGFGRFVKASWSALAFSRRRCRRAFSANASLDKVCARGLPDMLAEEEEAAASAWASSMASLMASW